MKKVIHRAADRGHANHGWLDAHHSFSFAGYHDPSKVHFGMLRVLNDDIIAAGKGFGAHPHDNMEIVTVPLSGSLQHRDNTGHSEIIKSGDVQIMSAGSGIQHSEANASATDSLNLLQIWVFPKLENITPRYEQKTFHEKDRVNKFQIVVSPVKEEGGVWINQDAWFSLAEIDANITLKYDRHKENNGMYLFLIEGQIGVEGEILNKRDAIGLSETGTISISATGKSKLLVIEIPMLLS
jgi:quercetin 2,3-dioxygenase